jgi:hypothetical protein
MPDVLAAVDVAARYLSGDTIQSEMAGALRTTRAAADTAFAELRKAREASRYAYTEGYASDTCTAEALARAEASARATRAAHCVMSAVYASRHYDYPEYYVAYFIQQALDAVEGDKCAEPAPANPYADEHKPEDIESDVPPRPERETP